MMSAYDWIVSCILQLLLIHLPMLTIATLTRSNYLLGLSVTGFVLQQLLADIACSLSFVAIIPFNLILAVTFYLVYRHCELLLTHLKHQVSVCVRQSCARLIDQDVDGTLAGDIEDLLQQVDEPKQV